MTPARALARRLLLFPGSAYSSERLLLRFHTYMHFGRIKPANLPAPASDSPTQEHRTATFGASPTTEGFTVATMRGRQPNFLRRLVTHQGCRQPIPQKCPRPDTPCAYDTARSPVDRGRPDLPTGPQRRSAGRPRDDPRSTNGTVDESA